jgi:glutamate/tyrosine decarboxylase-like PLP-dependent enzyme
MKDTTLRSTLSLVLDHALHHLSTNESRSVSATATLADLRQRIDIPLSHSGIDADTVVNELVSAVEGGLIGSTGGRFFGWVIGGSLPAALAADWLTSAWDQNAGAYAVAPAASVVEETAGRWLKELLHLPATASFAFVTGAQMAHVTCLAAARHALLTRGGWDVQQEGLSGAPAIRILTSTENHASTARAIRLLGLGEKHINHLPTDDDGRLLVDSLHQALKEAPSAPTIVVLQAGDLNIGAFDDFAALIPLAKKYGAWVHIDGAFGLWANASPSFRHLLKGVEDADSWVVDGHKWLNVPFDSGYAFIADRVAHRACFAYEAAYLAPGTEARDQLDWNPEFSRRARGFATYAAIRQLGAAGVAELIDRTCAHARAIVTRIGSLPNAEIVWTPQINQGLLRFLHPGKQATEQDHDAFTDFVISKILNTGEAFFTGTTWRGRRAMRVSVINWQTSPEDVTRAYQCVSKSLENASATII